VETPLVARAFVLESKPQGMPTGQREQDDSKSECRYGESQQENKVTSWGLTSRLA
jgi:hypothetical protein